MAIGFWNVERLGASTPEASRDLIAEAVEWFADHKNVGVFLFCEVTSDTTLDTDDWVYEISKIGTRRRRYRRRAAAQLGYACVTMDWLDLNLQEIRIPRWDELFDGPVFKKKGNVFDGLSQRRVLGIEGLLDGTNVFVYHANSSTHAEYLVTWVAQALWDRTGGNFVLLGDFNCTPTQLETYWDYIATHHSNDFRRRIQTRYWGHTHHARTGPTRTLDYAVTSTNRTVNVSSWVTTSFCRDPVRRDHPDHFPITATIS